MSDEKISIAELEYIVDIDTRPDGALSGHADLEAYGKARAALPVLVEVVKAALAWRDQRHQNLRDAVMRSEAEIEAESVDVRRARVKRTADLAMAIEAALSKVQP